MTGTAPHGALTHIRRENPTAVSEAEEVSCGMAEAAVGIDHSSGASTSASTSPALDQRIPWTAEVPALVMDEPLPENPDVWWLRLQRRGFVCGWQHVDHRYRDRSSVRTRT